MKDTPEEPVTLTKLSALGHDDVCFKPDIDNNLDLDGDSHVNGLANGVETKAHQGQGRNGHSLVRNHANGNDSKKTDGDDDDDEQRGCCGKNKKRKEKMEKIGIRDLFRFATAFDKLIIVLGTIGAIACGSAIPFNIAVLGEVINTFIGVNASVNGTDPYENVVDDMQPLIYFFFGNGIMALICGYVSISCWQMTSERQVNEMRKQFFGNVLRQHIGWFDLHEAGEISTFFSDDIGKIGDGIGDKMGIFIQWMSTGVAAYIMCFTREWRLTSCLIIFCPFVVFIGHSLLRVMRSLAFKEFRAYAKAGAIAEQAFRSIRTVQAFQGQEKEIDKYNTNLGDAIKVASKKGVVVGIGQSALWFTFFIVFAILVWLGVFFIQEFDIRPGNVLPVFIGILVGSMSLAQAFNNLENFANARGAAAKVFALMFLKPEIDTMSEEGLKPKSLVGNICLKNIQFSYPARPGVQILKGLDLEVKEGQHVALVGPSGCGKSTVIQLLQRFYDPHVGQLTVDGNDVKDLNLKWLRQHLGVVSQEPVLFATSIAENIRFGNLNATQEDIERAAKDANAHDFIKLLPQGYDTVIGERGAQLSGGQKQRIAIARALVKNPKILLLDEATSALDHESEAIVQNALDKAEVGRTTITIAHRLSTVRHADKIVAISEGEVTEEGTHEELMEIKGLYYQLVLIQTKIEEESEIASIVDSEEQLQFHSCYGSPVSLHDIADVEIMEEDDDEECTVENALLTASVNRGVSRVSKSSLKSAEKEINLVVMDSKRRSKKKFLKKQKESEEVEEKIPDVKLSRIMQYNAPEWKLILLGCFGSVLAGAIHPAFSFMMSEFVNVIDETDEEKQWQHAHYLAVGVIGVAFACAVLRMMQGYYFQRSGALLTARLRRLTFESLINQDIGYFDLPQNQVGTLITRLSSDASAVQGATGSKIGQGLEALSCLVCALFIAFFYGWKLALVVISFFPFMIAAGIVQGNAIAGVSKRERGQLVEAGKICSEVVDSIRTVASLGREDFFYKRVVSLVDTSKKHNMRGAHIFGLTYGVANSILFFAYAASFAYGSTLVRDGEMEFFEVFRVFSAIIFGGNMIGRHSSFGSDYAKAKVAASRVISLIDRKPKVDVRETGGVKMNNFQGAIGLMDCVFHYPTRPSIAVLDGIKLDINPGEKVALVGASGCGKSTTIQLVERFYDPDMGSVVVEGTDLRKVNLQWFRHQIGIVSQEPSLFDTSIAENIAYGDNSRLIPMDDIIKAAKAANIHNFVSSLPEGYDTMVGDKGTQLSGGQKQRIAIARALVRNPKILLLDEATSALDTESEKIVQEALDQASQQRTCIIIAHRLSTIQNADKIAVVNKGKIIESGTHLHLMTIKGAYYRLQKAQSKSKNN